MKTLIATLGLTAALISSSAYAAEMTVIVTPTVVDAPAAISAPVDVVTTINQDPTKAVINWDSFNTSTDAGVIFNNPSAAATTINHVLSSDALTISGNLNVADGSVLINGTDLTINSNGPVDLTGLTINTPGSITINTNGTIYGDATIPTSVVTPCGNCITTTSNVGATIIGSSEVHPIKLPEGMTLEMATALLDQGATISFDGDKAIFTSADGKILNPPTSALNVEPALFDVATATKHLDVAAMTFAAPAAATSAAELASLSPAAGGDVTPQDRANAYLNHVGLGAN